MGKTQPKAAYVVFRGRKPGVYYNWKDCSEQVTEYSKSKFCGYSTKSDAEQAWEEWGRKALFKRTSIPELAPRPGVDVIHQPTVWHEPHPDMRTWGLSTKSRNPNEDSPYGTLDYGKMMNAKELPKRACQTIAPQREVPTSPSTTPSSSPYLGFTIDVTGDSTLNPQSNPDLKRPSNFIDLTNDSEEEYERLSKRPKVQAPNDNLVEYAHAKVEQQIPTKEEEKRIELSPEQEKVVRMALRGENIFLTGAAGSGKTVTLKEILRRLKKKKKNVQVVAPTGIAALPLNGKTTYSFASVSTIYPSVQP